MQTQLFNVVLVDYEAFPSQPPRTISFWGLHPFARYTEYYLHNLLPSLGENYFSVGLRAFPFHPHTTPTWSHPGPCVPLYTSLEDQLWSWEKSDLLLQSSKEQGYHYTLFGVIN